MLETVAHSPTSVMPIQKEIEAAMELYNDKERWESIYLFSSEGFLLAHQGTGWDSGEENILEFTFSIITSVKLVENSLSVEEIAIRGRDRKMLVFYYFDAWNDNMVLAAVVSGKRCYRRALSRLVKHIHSLD